MRSEREWRGEVFPGVLRIRLPLPFELSSVNLYLVALDEGFLLIDCGMKSGGRFEILEASLAEARIAWTDIKQIVLTHMHPDHMGLALQVLELSGARLLMHQAEARQLEVVISPERRAAWINRAFAEAGVPKELQAQMYRHYLLIRENFFPLAPDQLLSGGEAIPSAIGTLQVLWTPGHSPGHICLYSEQHRVLFSGDHILPTITPNIAWQPGHNPLGNYLSSLAMLDGIEVALILPAHGEPFTGHQAWIRQTAQHHGERCDQISDLLLHGPRTAHSMVGDLWRKRLSPVNHQFAVLEIMAHLDYMQAQGRVRSEANGPALNWFV